jgi:nucleoside-diphosphate-sugar epimerase
MQQALVTGGTGFVGSNLVAELRARGWHVRCLVRDPQRAANLTALGAELCLGSLQSVDSIADAVADVDAVYHVAGRVAATHRRDFFLDNVEGTRAVLQASAERAKSPTVVIVSSLAAGGPSRKGVPRRESEQGVPTSAYGQSKLAAELAAAEFADRVPLSIVRPPVVLGPGDRNGLQLFKSVQLLRLHPVPGYRRMPISIVHVADLCAGIIQIAERGTRVVRENPAAGIYYITSGPTITYGQMGVLAARALGQRVLVIPAPKLVFWVTGGIGEVLGRLRRKPGLINWDKMREAVASGWECSDDKIRAELGYQPAMPLEQRFVDTVAWYREHGWL